MTLEDIRLLKLAAHCLDLVANSAHRHKENSIHATTLRSAGEILLVLDIIDPSKKISQADIEAYMSTANTKEYPRSDKMLIY